MEHFGIRTFACPIYLVQSHKSTLYIPIYIHMVCNVGTYLYNVLTNFTIVMLQKLYFTLQRYMLF